MRRLAITAIIIICFSFILEFNYTTTAAILLYLNSFIPIVLVWYLVAILQFAGEDIAVQTPFSIYLGISLISLLSQLFTPGSSLLAMGVLNGILLIYILVATFKIRNKKFSTIYRAYSISLLCILLVKLGAIFITPMQFNLGHPFFTNFIVLLDIVPLYIALWIINTAGEILKTGNEQLSA